MASDRPTELTREQVSAWRLTEHQLLERAPRERLLAVVSAIGGLHAQLLSSAEIAAWARLREVTPDDVRGALWEQRTLVKTWAMRGTLHLLPADDLPRYVAAARGTRVAYRRGSWLKYHGVSLAEIEAIIAAVPTALDGRCLTREQLADEVARLTAAPHVRELLLSGWGVLLKPAAYQGLLCFGPSQGQTVTFARPDQWLGAWREADEADALAWVVRRYLRAYGPSTHEDFARWWGVDPAVGRRLFAHVADELAPVAVEGRRAWALAAEVARIVAAPPARGVRLLPGFDPYVVAVAREADLLLPAGTKGRVYRPQGWISPVLLVDGQMAGVWRHERQRGRLLVQIEPFAPLAPAVTSAVEAEAESLGAFLGAPVEMAVA